MNLLSSTIQLMCGSAFGVLALASSADAQVRSFDIPPAAAVKAIPEFARQAGVQIIAPASQLGDVRTPALHGSFDVRQALTLLLQPTRLEIASDTGMVIALRPKSESPIMAERSMATAAAQPQTGATRAETVGIEELVVTARRREENVQDVPIAVTALGRAAIASRGIQTIADINRFSPGVYTTPSSRSSTAVRFILRGQAPVDSLLTADPSAAIYIDEVYVPRDYGLKTALFDVERIEILKGPQGTLYGRNSTGGAIGIFTREPDLDSHNGYATLEYGKYQSRAANGAVNIPLAEGVAAARLAFTYGATDGYMRGFENSHLNNSRSVGLRGSLLYRPTPKLELAATVGYNRMNGSRLFWRLLDATPGVQPADIEAGLNLGFPAATAGAAGDAFVRSTFLAQGRFRNDSAQSLPDYYEGSRASVRLKWEVSEDLTLKSVTGFERFQRTAGTDIDNTHLPSAQNVTNTEDRFFSQEVQATGSIGQRFNYVTGVYYGRETGNETARTRSLPLQSAGRIQIFDGDVRNGSLGVYAQGDFAITDQLNLTAGLRQTRDSRGVTFRNRDIFTTGPTCAVLPSLLDVAGVCSARLDALKFNNTSYTLSARYSPTETISVYATGRKGYRSGGWNLFTSVINGVPSFRPETVKDVELGAKTEWLDRRLRANLALFRSSYTDIQKQSLSFQPTGLVVRVINNAASATIKGAELEVTAKPVANFDINFLASYTDAGYNDFINRNPTTGAILSDRTAEPFEVPKWTYTIGGEYRWPLAMGQLSARLDWSWRDSVIFTSGAQLTSSETLLRQGGYGLLSGKIELSLTDPDISIAVVGRNLADKDYLSGGGDLRSLGIAVGYPGEPRYLGVQVTKRWQ